jgi:hypothetical protein
VSRIDQLAVEEAPDLVLGVGLVPVQVRELPAVPPRLFVSNISAGIGWRRRQTTLIDRSLS